VVGHDRRAGVEMAPWPLGQKELLLAVRHGRRPT
jgi:hypothetical protein